MIETADLWFIIIGLGVGSYALRFAFLGLVGGRQMPEWLERHLRYTAVAILPAIVAPLVAFSGEDGMPEPARLTAAVATCVAGYVSKNLFVGIIAGAVTLYSLLALLG